MSALVVFLVRIFPHSDWMRRDTGYLNTETFYAKWLLWKRNDFRLPVNLVNRSLSARPLSFQPLFTCLKSIMETPEQYMKFVQSYQ